MQKTHPLCSTRGSARAIFTPGGLPAATNALLPAGLTVLGCMRVDEEVVAGRRLRLEGLAGSRLVLHGRAGCVLC